MAGLVSFYEVLSAFAAKENEAITDIRFEPGMPITGKTPMGWNNIKIRGEVAKFDASMEQDMENFIAIQLRDGGWKSRMLNNREAMDMVVDMDDTEITSGDLADEAVSSTTRLRCKMVSTRAGLSWVAVMRKIPKKMLAFADTGMPPVVATLIERDRGLVVVTGPTGSGKTTSLTAMIDLINETRSGHIVTLENPIEYIHHNKMSIVTQREVPTDVNSFSDGLTHALRMSISAIVIGECLDRQTMETALTAAESGHLVFISMHTSSAPEAISRLASFFNGHERTNKLNVLSSVLNGVVAQALVPSASGDGWALASEVLVNTPEVSKLIMDDKLPMLEKQQGAYTSMNDSLVNMIKRGQISINEAMKTAYNPRELRDVLTRTGMTKNTAGAPAMAR